MRGVYLILDPAHCIVLAPLEVAEQALRGGVKYVQLRDKDGFFGRSPELKEMCDGYGATLFVNDDPVAAALIGAGGVHLGQNDIGIKEARARAATHLTVGKSTHSPEQAVAAVKEGADYIAIGSVFGTSAKDGARVVGLETCRRVREAVTLPLVAIGGITPQNAAQVVATRVDAIAVISGICGSPAPLEAVGGYNKVWL